MSISKYELNMLEAKRKEQELKEYKKRIGLIISIVFVVFLIGMLVFVFKDKVTDSLDTMDKSMSDEVPRSKD